MISPSELRSALLDALSPLPTVAGGAAVVVATAGPPPAIALLSSGDILVDGDKVRLAVFTNSSVARHLGGSCTLLVPTHHSGLCASLQPARRMAHAFNEVLLDFLRRRA